MNWSDVGDWLKNNATGGASLVGSLLTGNIPGAIAAGVSLVSGATGTTDPLKAMQLLQTDPATQVKLQELANSNEQSVREHIRAITELDLKDKQAEHEQTQLTIRSGDNAEDPFVRRTRPAQSWVSLLAAIYYALSRAEPDPYVLGLLLTLPLAYAGLRGADKWFSNGPASMLKLGKK